MVTTPEKIAQMELALAQARAEYERENGKRYDIIMREISPDEKQRILDSLTDRQERILFGLEAPQERVRPGTSGGDLTCPHCGKTGLTERGFEAAYHPGPPGTPRRRSPSCESVREGGGQKSPPPGGPG